MGVLLDPPGYAGHAGRRLGRNREFPALFQVTLTPDLPCGDGCLAAAM
ncbi:hypothetical protein [Pseudomonas sp.]